MQWDQKWSAKKAGKIINIINLSLQFRVNYVQNSFWDADQRRPSYITKSTDKILPVCTSTVRTEVSTVFSKFRNSVDQISGKILPGPENSGRRDMVQLLYS